MSSSTSIDTELSADELGRIKRRASRKEYQPGQRIFSEGDTADEMYFIESGRVSIVIQEFTSQDEVSILGAGELFGEMAFFSGDRRSATVEALEDTALLCLDRPAFLELYRTELDIAAKIDGILTQRNEMLTGKETLLDHPGIKGSHVGIGIKGDPSLRETIFLRERYQSVVDQYLPLLQPQLYELLLNRDVYEVTIHFNSGELQVCSVFDPFNDEVHPANKLVNKGYVQRHFPAIGYEEKARMVQRLYAFLGADPGFNRLAESRREGLRQGFQDWQPVAPATITRLLGKLPLLRKMPNLYLRNMTISIIRDTVRMQFNCDGAHFIGADAYENFIEQNVLLDELDIVPSEQRRENQRRTASFDTLDKSGFGERRTPPGRRQEDWEAYVRHMTVA